MVVAVDVSADPVSRVVEGLVLVQPHLPFFEFPEPALDEGLRLGVAVAASAVADSEFGEAGAEAAGGEGRAVVGAERQLAGLDAVLGDRSLDERDRQRSSPVRGRCDRRLWCWFDVLPAGVDSSGRLFS